MRMLILCLACFRFGVAGDDIEAGWLRFDLARPGNTQHPSYSDGWAPVHGFSFHSDEQGETFGRLGITRTMDKASPLLAEDVAMDTVFEWVELDLNLPDSASSPGARVRLLLENVMVAD